MQTLKLFRRMLALILTAATLLTVVPTGLTAHAASYQDPYLNQMVEWGFLRGDIEGNLRPDSAITRAEFVTIVNRAFGYTRTGEMPFTDVKSSDWYADDVSIAYNVGYIQGTSENTFAPERSITREEAAAILARNLMLQAASGENTDFTDSRDISNWSRGLITTLADYEIIDGYADGTFRPQAPITRGETAIMLVRAIGTPVQTAGVHSLGNVYGNVTINTSGVTLRNTVIAGNLYITAGVAEGNVLLENVTVLGEIVVSGGGVSESGEDSVVLRNVTSPKLVLDNVKNTEVSVRLEGDGVINVASIRTNAFLEDSTPADCGALRIELDGEDGRSLELAGNIKDVINLTPKSYLSLGAGQAQSITIDETATGTTLNIVAGAEVEEVNLDTAATITGDGDIGKLTVNTSGSTVSMLPDEIVIRPGETATIDGEKMDSAAAAESSADPRIQAGYPKMTDLAPTTATASFSTNKKGIVYWAVTSVTDGSVGADDLISPSSYSPKVLKQGSVSMGGANQAATAKISGLTAGGSYYLSTVFVDGREERSPVKVISFTTPDNTAPNFATGYPYMSRITNISAQVTTMATKTCRLYYAVLPKGATAPTAEDFKANAVTGNLGYGALDVTKNKPYTFDVNSVPLEELAEYDLYLWLTDIDGGASSAVKKLSFTTVDKTPPVFNTEPTINKVDKTAVGLYANLNEDGTLYWVVVKQGEVYPKPLAGQSGPVDWSSDTAKLQVSAGMNALKSGKVTMTEGKDVSFTVSGLDNQQSYDLYYVAQDKAGNFTASIGKITIHTQDDTAPTVTQEFTKYSGTDTGRPLSDTDVRLIFSETVQTVSNNTPLADMFADVTQAVGEGPDAEMEARNKMATALRDAIQLYSMPANSQPMLVTEATDSTDKYTEDWTIDYRYAEITVEDSKTVVTFPYGTALNLKSGAKYYFEIAAKTISDTSQTQNVMGQTKLPEFETIFAQINLSSVNIAEINVQGEPDPVAVHAVWQMDPVSTERVEDSMDWDMLIWTDSTLAFNLYRREGTDSTWEKLNKDGEPVYIRRNDTTQGNLGVSLTRDFLQKGVTSPEFEQLNTLKESVDYQYAMEFVAVNGQEDQLAWNGRVNIEVNLLAGSSNDLRLMAIDITESNWNETVVDGPVSDIGVPQDFTIKVPFTDQSLPKFTSGYPRFTPDATEVKMELLLNRSGTVYYVIAPLGAIVTTDNNGHDYSRDIDSASGKRYYELLPEDGSTAVSMPTFSQPLTMEILNPEVNYNTNPAIKYGNVACRSSVVEKKVTDLLPETEYIAYFVIQNTAQGYSTVQCYQFATTTVGTPYITLENQSPSVQFKTSENSELYYALVAWNETPSFLNTPFVAKEFLDSKYWEDGAQPTEPGKPVNGADKLDSTMTIMDALMTTVPQGSGNEGPSVFDIYANTTIKERVGSLIRRNQSGDSMVTVAGGPMNLDKNVPQVKDFTQNMKEGTAYYCMAVARNKDGTLDGFKVIGDVNIPDKQPPTLRVDCNVPTGSASGYSGTITLTFSEDLYWLNEEKTLKEVWTTKPSNATQAERAMYILDPQTGIEKSFGDSSKGLTVQSAASSIPRQAFILKYEGVVEGDTIILFAKGSVSDSHMNGRNPIVLTFVTEGAAQGGFATKGRFIITSGAIEGDFPTQ